MEQQQQQQQHQHIGRVRVAVRFQRGQQQQEQLFWTPALSSFVKQELREMYGPGMLCDEDSVVLSPTQELQPGSAYFYNVHAAPEERFVESQAWRDTLQRAGEWADWMTERSVWYWLPPLEAGAGTAKKVS